MSGLTVPPIPGFSGTPEQFVQIIWATTYADVASAALVTFDAFLTLDAEIRLVWHGRWGLPTLLYIINRYGIVLQACLNLVAVLDPNLDMPSCLAWNLFSNWTIPIVMIVVEATLVLRVVALYGNDRKFAVCLWAWYLINAAGMLTMMGLSMQGAAAYPSPAPPTLGCQIGGPVSYYWEQFLPALVLEATVAVLTLWKAIQHKRLLRTTPLLYVLMRDGFFYFFVVFALMLVNLVICLTTSELYFSWTPQISISIASVMAVRLFLNLRDVARPVELTIVNNSGPGTLEMSPIRKGNATDSEYAIDGQQSERTIGQESTYWSRSLSA